MRNGRQEEKKRAMQSSQLEKIVDKPPVFRDDAARDWTIRLTSQAIDDVLDLTQVDLIPEGENVSGVIGLCLNHRLLSKVLWCLCRKQAEAKQIDERSFKEGLEATALSKAWGALVDAILFFIQETKGLGLAKAFQEIFEAEIRVIEAGATEMLQVLQASEVNEAMKDTAKRIGAEMKQEILSQLASSATK